jgi:perosamine synthetase
VGVDLFGHPAEWDPILEIARRRDLRVIDDACESLGATYRGRPVGSLGHATTFAFYPNKQITTGEGGMLVTQDDGLARLARSLRNQGRADGGQRLEHTHLGYNYRLDEMSAALGLAQARRLDTLLARREVVAGMYAERLSAVDWLRPPVVRPHVQVSRFAYVVTVDGRIDRDSVLAGLEARGVPARPYFPPVHLQPYLQGHPSAVAARLPVTEELARLTIALPFHGRMVEAQVDLVVRALRESGPRVGRAR